jgi:hypothetical protein
LQSLSEASLQQAKKLEVDKSCYEETLSKLEHSPMGDGMRGLVGIVDHRLAKRAVLESAGIGERT